MLGVGPIQKEPKPICVESGFGVGEGQKELPAEGLALDSQGQRLELDDIRQRRAPEDRSVGF
jgi:hypothetical protein